jgi:diguanylate cyclase (GGDEF)-like protein
VYEDISEQAKAAEAQRQHAESLDRVVKELEVHTNHMHCLSEMGTLLTCSGSIKEACEVISSSLKKLFPAASFGALYLFRASRDLLETVAAWGRETGSAETFTSDGCWALRRGRTHWIFDRLDAIACRHVTRNSPIESVCVPMVAQGNTLGILHLQFTRAALLRQGSGIERGRCDEEQLAISAASQIALSLASLQLRETLRDQAIRDPLTRLFNRRFLEESLEREIQLAARKKQSLTVLFLDLDHFKKFNDAFGHDAGDMVLQALADLFRDFFRSTDICCRYGGEEFAIILPESSARDTVTRANALRLEIKKLRLQYKKQALGQLTVSAGVAGFPEHGSTATDLLTMADRCLYESKARGRDVVTLALKQKA